MDIMTQRARKLRYEMTDAERLIWCHLRNRQLPGCKFRRQHVIAGYIVDFVCLERKLIIELDGGQHAGRQAYDARRSEILIRLEYQVMRFWNNETMTNLDDVIETILFKLSAQNI